MLISVVSFSQSKTENNIRTISGFVYFESTPLSRVSISLSSNQEKGTTTNNIGFFKIKAKVGEILIFNYLGLKTIKIYIEDTTATLNIKMREEDKMLEEVSINSKIKKDSQENSINEVLQLGRNNINVRSSGFGVKYINGKDLSPAAFNVIRAIQGKVSGLRVKRSRFGEEQIFLRPSGSILSNNKPVLWDIDGIITDIPPQIEVSQIEHIGILSSLGATNAYGAAGASGVIIISTKSDRRRRNKGSKENNAYTNKEFYQNDANNYEYIEVGKPDFLSQYDGIITSENAYVKYRNQYDSDKYKSNFHFKTITLFQKKYNKKHIILKIMDDFEEFSKNNIEELKTIAFKYQELNEGRKALKIYKKIANLRPNHAQSYRDLANSYLELKDYKNAWKIYKYYFIKGLKIESNDIGDILNSEMILTYLQRKKDTSFTEVLKTIDANKVIKSDVRFVFEWNTSEAEFIWEFVNSNKQVYTEENSLNADSDLIINQKTKGYTSKEFLIEKLENSPWLINLTYLGNKQYKSTILKLTTYYNWGEVNQSKKVETFELNVENLKIQLDKISF